MNQKLQYIDWGLMDYKEAWDRQKLLFDEMVEQKKQSIMQADASTTLRSARHDGDMNAPPLQQHFIVCEHPHVYTLGKNGQRNNLLINDEFLKKINASYYHIERGGDITYHGPGQLVGYPILDLEQCKLSLKKYIFCLEEAIIRTLLDYQIESSRMDGATGVWLDVNGKNPRKISAIGVRASRNVTMHGFALNVNTDLSYFSHINPCGFTDKGVTSLSKELTLLKASPMEKPIDMNDVKQRIFGYFQELLIKG